MLKTGIIFALGLYIGRGIYLAIAEHQAAENELAVRKRLQQFINENLAGLAPGQVNREMDSILKGRL